MIRLDTGGGVIAAFIVGLGILLIITWLLMGLSQLVDLILAIHWWSFGK